MIKLYFQQPEESLFPQADLPRIISICNVSDNPTWFYDMHKHDDYCEIMFVKDGRGKYTLDNTPYEVKTGDLVVLNKGVVHAEASDPTQPLSVWTCSVGNIHLTGMEQNTILPNNMVPVISAGALSDTLEDCFEQIYQERTEQRPGYEALVQLSICRIIALIHRLVREDPVFLTRERGKALSESVKQYIDIHYAEEITLAKLSDVFHVSTYHIVHEMKKDVGTSPINYLIGRRIGEAQRLLLSTDMTVSDIAQAVGYGNISYFMNLFNRRVGMTPTRFKELYVLGNTGISRIEI